MATGAVNSEVYSISEPRTGDVRVSRLVLTGWGADPSSSAGIKTWSDRGRMWCVFTASTNDFSILRRTADGGTDEVCSGTVSNGKVTLTADNTSGISGSADVDNGTPGTNPTEDSTLDIVVTYDCDENDVASELGQVQSLLSSGAWEGEGTRLEAVLNKAKRMIDKRLISTYLTRLRLDDWGRYLLAHITNTSDLSRCQALYTAHLALLNRTQFVENQAELSAYYLDLAEKEFKTFTPIFDYERDLDPDDRRTAGVVQLHRR